MATTEKSRLVGNGLIRLWADLQTYRENWHAFETAYARPVTPRANNLYPRKAFFDRAMAFLVRTAVRREVYPPLTPSERSSLASVSALSPSGDEALDLISIDQARFQIGENAKLLLMILAEFLSTEEQGLLESVVDQTNDEIYNSKQSPVWASHRLSNQSTQ